MASDSTSSLRCVSGSVTSNSNHEFEVTNYRLLDGMGIGKFVSSSTFSVGGCDWRINMYPDGNDKKDKGAYVSAFLYLVRGTAGVIVTTTLSLDCNDSEQVTKTYTKAFEAVGDDWGYPKFIEKSRLREFLQSSGGRFTIRCVVMIKEEVLDTEDVGTVIQVPEPKLHKDLTDMLKSREGADVTFSVGGRLFPAHRCILGARSMVFKAELFGAMKEKDAQRIEIDDMEPAVFEALLHFFYTDSLPDDYSVDNAAENNVAMQHLLVAADRYGLDRLRLICEAKLCRYINVQTVATTLGLAEQHHCTQLKGACIGFIASRDVLGAVMESDGFKHLITSCPVIMKEILDKVAAVWTLEQQVVSLQI